MVLRSFISAIVRSPIAVRLGLFSRTRQELAWQDELLSMSTRFATQTAAAAKLRPPWLTTVAARCAGFARRICARAARRRPPAARWPRSTRPRARCLRTSRRGRRPPGRCRTGRLPPTERRIATLRHALSTGTRHHPPPRPVPQATRERQAVASYSSLKQAACGLTPTPPSPAHHSRARER